MGLLIPGDLTPRSGTCYDPDQAQAQSIYNISIPNDTFLGNLVKHSAGHNSANK